MQHTPHQSQLRKGRYSHLSQIYHVIFNTKNRKPLFNNFAYARLLIQQLSAHQPQASTLAFVVMPDHVHWLLQLNQSQPLSLLVKSVKAKTAQAIGQPIWQAGYYDHAVRKDEDIVNIARYIIANLVRAGLVKRVGDYPHWDAIWL